MIRRNMVIAAVSVMVTAVLVLGLVPGCAAPSPAPTPAPTPAPPAPTPAPPAPPPAPETIKLGLIVALHGMNAGIGEPVKNGWEIGVQHVNEAGGVYVKEYDKKIPLELIIYDDETIVQKTISRMETAYSMDKIDFYAGGVGCDAFEVGSAIAEKNKTPWIGPGCAANEPLTRGYKYIFKTLMTTFQQAETIFDAIEHDMPREEWPTKIGIFQITMTDSEEQTQGWTERAAKDGFEVVSVRKHTPADTDFTAHIEAMKAAGVDMLLGYPTPPQGVTIRKQMSELDFQPKVVCFIRAPNVPTFGESLGSLSDYVSTTVRYDPALPFPGNDRLNAVCQELYGRPPPSGRGSGLRRLPDSG